MTIGIEPQAPAEDLPVHFFSIVLNGQPFIRYHIDVFRHLPFAWHWHIVEGVADLKHDSSWPLKNGGKIVADFHDNGLSKDGSSQYVDWLQQRFSRQVTVYRKPDGIFWDGKLEMVSAPLAKIASEALLWQVDIDEFWTHEQICTAREMFLSSPQRRAAYYWCYFFVGPHLMVSRRNSYSQNPAYEWLRTWRITPRCRWLSHEPPEMVEVGPDGARLPLSGMQPFLHDETERLGLVFQHFAYVLKEQLRFKEFYYGYSKAVSHWSWLQKQSRFPLLLREYLPWVRDETTADTTQSLGIIPIPLPASGSLDKDHDAVNIRIAIDGVFFQVHKGGIARVWLALLKEWASTSFAANIIILDRDGTFPRIDGYRYRTIAPHSYDDLEGDRSMLQELCIEEGVTLFVSTYFSYPLGVPTVLMVHDLTPEALTADLNKPKWVEKRDAINNARSFVSVSHSTARDLIRYYPQVAKRHISVVHNGVDSVFSPAADEAIEAFRRDAGIDAPYFLYVGSRTSYKNPELLFRAFAKLSSMGNYHLVCAGDSSLEAELMALVQSQRVNMVGHLDDSRLAAAYSGAQALVYPSYYEGFGLPVLEAMSCGCPVISHKTTSLPEVGGDALYYLPSDNEDDLLKAMLAVGSEPLRSLLVRRGIKRAGMFSWQRMSREFMKVLTGVHHGFEDGKDNLLLEQSYEVK